MDQLELRKWAIEQATKVAASPDDCIIVANRFVQYVAAEGAPTTEPLSAVRRAEREIAVNDLTARARDLPQGFDILSAAEKKIYLLARQYADASGIVDATIIAEASGHASAKSLASQIHILSRYGLVEYTTKGCWRIIPEEERAAGVALSAKEKGFLKEIWSYRDTYGSITTGKICERHHYSDVTISKYMKILVFAGYVIKQRRQGEWLFVRDPMGNTIEHKYVQKVELKKVHAFEPYKRADGTTVYPPGYKATDDFPEIYDDNN